MAIVLRGKTHCSICDSVISQTDEVVSTSHFIADENDPFWKYSDSAMHRCCFMQWEQRDNFAAKFNNIVGRLSSCSGRHVRMEADGSITRLKHGG